MLLGVLQLCITFGLHVSMMAPPTAARMAAAKAGRAMYARGLEQEKPMYFTFRQLTQPEFVGGCALAELSMCMNTSAYSEQCGQSVHMRASLDGRNRCDACRMITEMHTAWISGELPGILDIQAWFFSTEVGRRHLKLWGGLGSVGNGAGPDVSQGDVEWEEAILELDALRAAAKENGGDGVEDDWWASVADVRTGRVECGDDADPELMMSVDEFEYDVPVCGSCGRWLYGWRVRGRVVLEPCLCKRGKLKAKLDANFPLRDLPDDMVFAIGANAMMRDSYKVNQLLCMTAHTTPSSDKIRGSNHPRFNAAFKAAGKFTCGVLLEHVGGMVKM